MTGSPTPSFEAPAPPEGPPVGSGRAAAADRADELARELVEAVGPHVSGILLFGSHLAGTSPDPHSAYDFVVIVDRYLPFYRRLVEAGHHSRSPALLAGLSHILPPNITAFVPDLPGRPVAKCMIISERHFERALSPSAPDHLLKGRMSQSVAVIRARDEERRLWIEDCLAEGRQDVLRWAGPHLPPTFTPAELARRMLEVSYAGEVRPESADRVEEVFEAQRDRLDEMYREVLEEAARRDTVVRVDEDRYRPVDRPGRWDRLRNRVYFTRSKLRATIRWFKHIFTFPDWLDYIRRKLERRAGREIELTERERKYPLIFLWPRFFRILRTLPGAGGSDRLEDRSGGGGEG